MKTKLVVACLALLASAAQAQSCVPFRYEGRSIVVQAKVNGVALDMLVDTGANTTVISSRAYATIDTLPKQSVTVYGALGARLASEVSLKALEVADKKIENLPIIVLTIPKTSGASGGILGQDFLEHFTVTIDYKHRCIMLDKPR